MGENISHAELFRIINRAVAGCANHKNIPVNIFNMSIDIFP